MTGLVVPRPIAWISTRGIDGVRNVAPHSYFNLVAHDPPHIMFSATGVRDTLTNVRATGQFVVNIVSADLVIPMNLSAADMPPGEDEFIWAGLSEAPAHRVTAPRVAEAKAHLECEVRHELEVGGAHMVVAEVVHVHVSVDAWKDGRIDPALLDPVCRLGGTSYATLGEVFKLPRPRWEEISNGGPDPGASGWPPHSRS